ncbi:MAG: peptide-binding protein [Firmicutes bacterium]|nr:peptide-binding protein [Bacillota bacterium]
MAKKRRLLSLAVLLTAAALVLAACGGGGNQQQSEGGQQGEQSGQQKVEKPATGGELVLVLAQDPDILNPLLASTAYGGAVLEPIFESLVTLDENLIPQGELAERWEVSEDGLEWTFYLNKNAKWQDGEPVTADDVVFTFKTIMDPDYTGPRKSELGPTKDVVKVDDYTVKFILEEPFAPFLVEAGILDIVPEHLLKDVPVAELEQYDQFNQHPIGSGPYKFVEWKAGEYVLLERWEDYWNKSDEKGPFVDGIRYRIIKEDNTQIAALEAQEVDALGSVTPTEVDRLKTEKADILNAYDWDRNGFGYMILNTQRWPTSEKEVRQALAYALNYQAIIDGVLDGKATVPPGPLPPVSWAYDPSIEGRTYDPAKAAQILEAAGWKKNANGIWEKDGKTLTIEYYGTAGSSVVEGIAQQAMSDWKALGVDVKVELMDFNTMLEKYVDPGNYHVTFMGFSLGPDPNSLYALYHTESIGLKDGIATGFNTARYSNPQVDQLLEEGRRVADMEKRKQIYSQVQKLIIEDQPHIWIYANKYTDFVNKRVKGVVNQKGYGTSLSFVSRWYIETAAE